MMCVCVEDVYKEKVKECEVVVEKKEELNSESRREEGIRWMMCVSVVDG
jgi:hypothetical protein